MEEKEFQRTLDNIREATLPDCPANLEQNVLRKIRLQRQPEKVKVIDWLQERLFSKGFAVPIVAVAIVLSAFVSSIGISQQQQSSYSVAEAMGFDSIVETRDLLHFSIIGI